jgi:photosystem II stability/assembly factor-like uncharacterized protein
VENGVTDCYQRFQQWFGSLLFLAVSALVGCANDDVLLDVLGVGDDVRQLEVNAWLNDRPIAQPVVVRMNLELLALTINSVDEGRLRLVISGLSENGCRVAESPPLELQYTRGRLTPQRQRAELFTLPRPQCELEISQHGEGTISVNPVRMACDRIPGSSTPCRREFPFGTTVVVDGLPTAGSRDATWEGACSGRGSCVVDMTGRRAVTGWFSPQLCADGATGPCTYLSPVSGVLRGIWGSSFRDIWGVGDKGAIAHFDGSRWSVSPQSGGVSTLDLNAVWGSGPADVWAAGAGGTLLHYDGTLWQAAVESERLEARTLRAVSGSSRDAVWAVGDQGVVLRFDGQRWQRDEQGSALTLYRLLGVWSSAASNVWVSGAGGVLLHRGAGGSWSLELAAQRLAPVPLTAVWGIDDRHVWAVGVGGALLAFNGTSWQTEVGHRTLTSVDLLGLSGRSEDELWAVGQQGVILKKSLGAWSLIKGPRALTSSDLLGVYVGDNSTMWAAGDTLAAYQP